jgi:hypothetical protein
MNRFFRTQTYRHTNGDLFVIEGLVYPQPIQKNPATGAIIRRTRDNKVTFHSIDQLQALVAEGNLKQEGVVAETPVCLRINAQTNRVIIVTDVVADQMKYFFFDPEEQPN